MRAELLDLPDPDLHSSSGATSSRHVEGGPLPDDHSSLAQIIAAAVALALRATQRVPLVSSPPASSPLGHTMTIADMDLRTPPRSSAEMDLSRIQVACTAHGATVEAWRKIRDRLCVVIEPKFLSMDFSKLVSNGASDDLGTMVLAQQTMLDKCRSWCQQVDVVYIFRIPSLSEFHDHKAVASASRVDLLTQYKTIPLGAVLKYQAFVNEWRSDIDVESCDWALQVLELSTAHTLLVQIIQSFDILPTTQQGGLTLFKLLVDKLDAKTFENTKLLQDYITTFRLDRIPGENVSLGSSCFKAAAKMLSRSDLPTDLLQHYLRGMSACGNDEFRSICSSQLGFLSTPMYEEWSLCKSPDILVQLDVFVSKSESKYDALKASRTWSGTNLPDSTFQAVSSSSPPVTSRGSTPQAPNPSWQCWFDSKTCGICGKSHPTKYHDDPEIRNRPYAPKTSSSQRLAARHPGSSRSLACTGPRFKTGGKGRFIRSVHQALLENAKDCDTDLLANLAGSDLAPDDEDEPSQTPESHDADDSPDDVALDDSAAQALAAIGLDQLLNW